MSSPPNYCTTPNIYDEDSCLAINGTFVDAFAPYSCYFPDRNTAELCLPDSICPPLSNDTTTVCFSSNLATLNINSRPFCFQQFGYYTSCQSIFCYSLDSKEDCECSMNRYWASDYAGQWSLLSFPFSFMLAHLSYNTGGNGLCIETVGTQEECAAIGSYWWTGFTFAFDLYATEDRCNKGICVTGDSLYTDILPEDCPSIRSCLSPCDMCISLLQLMNCEFYTEDECTCNS